MNPVKFALKSNLLLLVKKYADTLVIVCGNFTKSMLIL